MSTSEYGAFVNGLIVGIIIGLPIGMLAAAILRRIPR